MSRERTVSEAALDAFLVELGRIQDTVSGRARADGVSEREWGLRYLRELVSSGRVADMRDLVDGKILLRPRDTANVRYFESEMRALFAALDLAGVLCADDLAAIADPGKGACRTCGKTSPRHYCEACANELGVMEQENPLHGERAEAA